MKLYGELFRQQYVKKLLPSNVVGRLPEGMGPLVVALFLREQGFEYSLVGVLAALYGISAAVGTPVLGRCVDLYGQVRVLAVCMLASTAGFLALSITPSDQVLLAGMSIVAAGLFTPPLEPCLRSLWPRVLTGERTIKTAYALDATLQELVFVSGPLLVVIAVEAMGPAGALVTTGLLGLLGTITFITTPPVRRWQAEHRQADWAGPLRSATLRQILMSLVFAGATIGLLNISVIAYSEANHANELSGIILATNAFGALIGGLVYGSRSWPGSSYRHFQFLMFTLAVGYVPLAFAPPPVVLIPCAALSGISLAPALASAFAVVGSSVPSGTSTEAFAWLVTIFMAGNAAGSTLAGTLLQHIGLHAAFWAPPTSALCGFLVFTGLSAARRAKHRRRSGEYEVAR
ncbi:putative MFS family arabinose efflux permease [Actinopolyspora biskrensis]|uniref:Putative MFS family arabinose efflux permease n=1 Tax=Actinopolyspora biskrensis TaxID=1470178 RepID=A0A852Z1U8_9ACTN|nr:putative MFS family arabinose efflux permease [Actinopolyspora biskrensis]